MAERLPKGGGQPGKVNFRDQSQWKDGKTMKEKRCDFTLDLIVLCGTTEILKHLERFH